MTKSESPRYEAPRAVRLSDATTGAFSCLNGPTGTADTCQSGFAVQPRNVCASGGQVVP
jgi:hypothetical protein